MSLSERSLIALYRSNQEMLNSALINHDRNTQLPRHTLTTVANIGYKLDHTEYLRPEDIVACTDALFHCIAELSDSANAAQFVERINSRLHRIRIRECQLSMEIRQELMCICELLLEEKFDKLVDAIDTYHKDRLMLTSNLTNFRRH